ncbi:nitroreductase family protein [Robiginitomaculum antarcticum]|uniref:nitroreductase family protein n=1 Tax=Robiginitomaculum antarcticum TaxID=437507 RepID=UPI00038270C2|nr:nitroreductase [Robiginitomaculum antarcticum]
MIYSPTDRSDGVLAFLEDRRSPLAKLMTGPGPTAAQVNDIIARAARVPDHRKLGPWRFIVIRGKMRETLGQYIGARFTALNPDKPLDKAVTESQRFIRAPTVVAVVSAPVDDPKGTPDWEQVLSAGAVCFQMLLVARAMGFAAQWLTEWIAYDEVVLAKLGLSGREKIAGFIYLGDSEQELPARSRPDIDSRITRLGE